MSSHLPTCLLLSLFAACQSRPQLSPLPVHDVFAVAYEGNIAPLTAADAAAFAGEPAVATPAGGPSVSFKATIVALSPDAACALLPGLLGDGRSGQPAGGYVDATALRRCLDELADRGCVRAAPITVVCLGNTAATTASTRTSFVSWMKVSPISGSVVLDPEIDAFEHGSQLAFTPRRDGDALHVEVEWRVSEPVLPIPQVRTRNVTLQVPVLARHCLRVAAKVGEHGAFVLGALPVADDGSVELLFVEVDGSGALLAAK